MNEMRLFKRIDMLRDVCHNKKYNEKIKIEYRYDNEWLEIYKDSNQGLVPITVNDIVYRDFIRIEEFSLHNLKKLLSVIKKERLNVEYVKIKW